MSITWSITIPTFNSADYLEETLISVLKQDLGPERMEIVVVDNCSTDDTPNLVRRVGKGRIKFIANEKNIGAYGNFNKCVDVAKGELIHLLNSDDVVNPGFYAEFEAAFTDKEVYLVSCNSEVINERGDYMYTTPPITSLLQPSNNTEGLLTYNKFRTPAVVVRRAAYEVVGRFDTELVQ